MHIICPHCSTEMATGDLTPLEDVEDLLERVQPGELVPQGECPECGGLVPVAGGASTRIILHMEGGIVQHVEADRDVNVLLLDADTEGAETEDLLEIQFPGHAMPCVRYVREPHVNIDPAGVEELYRQAGFRPAAEKEPAGDQAPFNPASAAEVDPVFILPGGDVIRVAAVQTITYHPDREIGGVTAPPRLCIQLARCQPVWVRCSSSQQARTLKAELAAAVVRYDRCAR